MLELPLDTAQVAVVGLAAFAASVASGVSGHGAGLLLALVVAPLVGVQDVIALMAVVTALTNAGRLAAFRRDIDWGRTGLLLLVAAPGCLAGAFVLTLIDQRLLSLWLGGFLLATVPLRWGLARVRYSLGKRGLALAGAGYGLVAGGMTGTGCILLSVLMAGGLQGATLIATDAAISLGINLAKAAVFSHLGRLNPELAALGLVAGSCAVPGAFVARWLLHWMPRWIHAIVMDTVVALGAAGLLWQGQPFR